MLRQCSLVKLTNFYFEWLKNHTKEGFSNPLLEDDQFVFLGEIPNMPDHCVVVGTKTSKNIFRISY